MKTWHWVLIGGGIGAAYLFLRAYSGAGLPAWMTGKTLPPAVKAHP